MLSSVVLFETQSMMVVLHVYVVPVKHAIKVRITEYSAWALLHELKLSLNPKLPLSSRTLLVKMALIFCCINNFKVPLELH